MPKKEADNKPGELHRGDLLEDGEDGGEDEIEGSQGGDGPGRDSKGAIQAWVWIPHIGHSKCQQPPEDE